MVLPKLISPCPIAEAIFEIRFVSELPDDAVFGTLYSHFKDEFPDFEKLNILQLPEQIRSNDENLKYKPYYKAQRDNILLQVGPRVLSLVNLAEYQGWDKFSVKILETYKKLMDSGNLKYISRIALRYVNVFPGENILRDSTLNISLYDDSLSDKTVNLSVELPLNNCVAHLRMVNNAEVVVNQKKLNGSLVDIDTVYNREVTDFKTAIEEVHSEEKKLFFSLLDKNFIETLNPIYE